MRLLMLAVFGVFALGGVFAQDVGGLEVQIGEIKGVIESAKAGLKAFETENQEKIQNHSNAVADFNARKKALIEQLNSEMIAKIAQTKDSAAEESQKLFDDLESKYGELLRKEIARQAKENTSPVNQYLVTGKNRRVTDFVTKEVFLKQGGDFGPYGNAYHYEAENVYFVNLRNMYVRSDFNLRPLNKILGQLLKETKAASLAIEEIAKRRDVSIQSFTRLQNGKIAAAEALVMPSPDSVVEGYYALRDALDRNEKQMQALVQTRNRILESQAEARRAAEAKAAQERFELALLKQEQRRQEEERTRTVRINELKLRLGGIPSTYVSYPSGYKPNSSKRVLNQKISGQVFVTGRNAENYRLGGVSVKAYDAADFGVLVNEFQNRLNERKRYQADEAVYHSLTGEWPNGAQLPDMTSQDLANVYDRFPATEVSGETDADGLFHISIPYKQYVLFAVASRHVGTGVEHYLWVAYSEAIKEPERVLLNGNNVILNFDRLDYFRQ